MSERKQLTGHEIKQAEIGILDYIDFVCRKNNLSYNLDYGTLLGAVRHKGFIPWDDDIDISMPRKDYNKFLEIVHENDSRYKLLCQEYNPNYFYEFAKIVDSHTKLKETDTIDLPEMGVWVDVFPRDRVPKHYRIIRPFIIFAVTMRIFAVQPKFPRKHSILFYPLWLIARVTGFRLFLRLSNYLSTSCKSHNSKYEGYLAAMTKGKYFWETALFDNLIKLPFEEKNYPAPHKYHQYLTDMYGEYMTLPPEDKRVRHSFTVYWNKC